MRLFREHGAQVGVTLQLPVGKQVVHVADANILPAEHASDTLVPIVAFAGSRFGEVGPSYRLAAHVVGDGMHESRPSEYMV